MKSASFTGRHYHFRIMLGGITSNCYRDTCKKRSPSHQLASTSLLVGDIVMVVPYTFVCRGVPVREDTYPEPSASEVGRPVPFVAAFISPVATRHPFAAG